MSGDPRDFFRKPPEGGSHADRVAPERSPAADAAPLPYDVGSTEYKAYGVMPGGSSDCDVRAWKPLRMDMPEGAMFDYRLLTMIRYSALDLDGRQWEVDLMFPDMIIRLIGRNLEDLRFKLRRRQIAFIQQYSPRVHHVPIDRLPEGDPVIEQIHIMQAGDLLAGRVPKPERPN